MKGEYRDDQNNPHPSTTMFSKFNHHHHHPHQPPQQPPPPPQSQHFTITTHPFRNTSEEEADSRNNHNSPNNLAITPIKDIHTNTSDGASIEVVRRPRGRPPGSKNKPKPPVIITREPDPSMSPYVLELPTGTDIVDAVLRYCRKRNIGLCVLTGSGTVMNVSLRQPSTTAAATVTFHGRFNILSISATVLPSLTETAIATPFANGFSISLAGPQGQIVGGAVAGPLMSGGPVYIIAASFNNPMYHRLSSGEDETGGGTGSAGASEQSLPAERSAGGDSSGGHHHPPQTTAADTMSMYSHLQSDVIWAPTARQGPLHPPRY
ncbi:AT-hook motif nuclear-localized protein 28-like [Rutidosis leptorrhynchoides]|uniref:AT-hook motif nuclear-localized protein 28-like n=1 Tax=Rutidosis leptorrhynchoides TaxID=125765 RepID=UPI003A999937